jgi:hypothetical protein
VVRNAAGVAVQRQGLRRLPKLPPPPYRRWRRLQQRPQHARQQVTPYDCCVPPPHPLSRPAART